jgi:hypothetical protein
MLDHEHTVLQNIVFVAPVISQLSLLSRKSSRKFSRAAVFCFVLFCLVLYNNHVRRVAPPTFVSVAPISQSCVRHVFIPQFSEVGAGVTSSAKPAGCFFNWDDFTSPDTIVARYYCRF